MKFMVTWQLHPGKLHETLAKFAKMTAEQEQALGGNQVKIVGRWHDLVRGRGVAILETDNAKALSQYSLAWNQVMELDIAPVVDDGEARTLGGR